MTVPSGSSLTISLPPYWALTVVASADGSGSAVRLAASMGNQAQSVTPLAAGSTTVLGPYATPERFDLVCSAGSLAPSTAPVDFPTLAEATAAALVAAADVHIVATDKPAGLVELFGEGAPVAAVQATLDVNPAGDDNGLTFTAVEFGEGGNDISIEYIDPGTAESPLAIAVVGKVITVTLETDNAEPPDIVSTAADVLAAIEASGPADALVTVVIDTSDTGTGDDGSGVVTAMEIASLAGGAGVGVGEAGKGSRYTDIGAGTLYLNTGDETEPVWSQLAPV